jgi:hypothetical protein
MKKRIAIWLTLYLLTALFLLTFVASDFTLHRRAAVTAYTKWIRNPTPETKAAWDRESDRNFAIQMKLSAAGSLAICGIAYASFAGIRWIAVRVKRS